LKIVGIDLAASPRNCGVCVLEEDTITHVTRGSRNAEHPGWLLEHCSGAHVVAVDVPFGWPKPFAHALSTYGIGVALDRDRKPYLYRTTDIWVTDELPRLLARDVGPPRPLSVSADKLGVTAMVGTLLQKDLRNGFNLWPSTANELPAVVEVYPALSLWAWALPHRNYKGDSGDARRKRRVLLGQLYYAFGLEVHDEQAAADLIDVEHCFDALVAALTGREYASGNTFDPQHLDADLLSFERWIRVPKSSLDRSP
jgi:predicted nuclease with RNAse H fold